MAAGFPQSGRGCGGEVREKKKEEEEEVKEEKEKSTSKCILNAILRKRVEKNRKKALR